MVSSRRGSPTLRRRQLGMQVRWLRETAGITIDQVAESWSARASRTPLEACFWKGRGTQAVHVCLRSSAGKCRGPDEAVSLIAGMAKEL
jgi:hypothetical protein